MPDLIHSLQGHDLGHLLIVAGFWDLDLEAPDARAALPLLVEGICSRELVAEVVGDLPEEAQAALGDLQRSGGRLAWPQFTRRHGLLREMGPGSRDRERPHRDPASATEVLWYRALLARAFFDTPDGPLEFAYLPDDLLALLPELPGGEALSLGRPASPAERKHIISASDRILDHACTLLAALRLEMGEEEIAALAVGWTIPPADLQATLTTAGLLDENSAAQPEPTRAFLEAGRGEALAILTRAWLNSPTHNDLQRLPHLQTEGEWENDPLRARKAILGFLANLPRENWWSLTAFVASIKEQHADFQRPAGDYDSWYLRDAHSGDFLRGFENWDAVDGALIRYIITGPLHWLGVFDLAAPEPEAEPTAFRASAWAAALLSGEAPKGLPSEEEPLYANARGDFRIPRLTPRAARYQLSRFCAWDGEKGGEYRFRLTPASLTRAQSQGLRVSQLLALLRRHAETALPPNLVQALKRWDAHGTQAHIEEALVLRLSSPGMLKKLRKSRAARFLSEPLGPAAVIVKAGAWEKILEALVEMGYLGDVNLDDHPQKSK